MNSVESTKWLPRVLSRQLSRALKKLLACLRKSLLRNTRALRFPQDTTAWLSIRACSKLRSNFGIASSMPHRRLFYAKR